MSEIIFKNFWYKVTAILLATLIWAIVQGEEVMELERQVSVRVLVPEAKVIRGDNVVYLDATVRGPRILLGNMNQKQNIQAVLRIPEAASGDVRYRISRENIPGWDDRISIQFHEPASVSLFVDEKATAELPIREVLQGAPNDGFTVEKVTVTPEVVSVTGLKSELKKVKELLTEPIDVTGLAQSKTIEIPLQVQAFSNAELSVPSISVALQIGEAKKNRRFENIPVSVVGGAVAPLPRLKPVSIEIQSTPSILNSVSEADLAAFVDVSGLEPGKFDKDVQVKIPSDTVLIEVNPKAVQIQVLPNKLKSK